MELDSAQRALDKRHYLRVELYERMRDPQFFDFLQQGSLDGLWYWDLENPDQQWMSPRFWRLLGFEPSQKKHLADEWKRLMFAEDLKRCMRSLERHLENPAFPYDEVARFRHRQGQTIGVRARGIAVRDERGEPVRVLGTHTDLTRLIGSEELVAALRVQIEALKVQVEALQVQKSLLIKRLRAAGISHGDD